MEVVSAVSSIAGLIALAGQILSGIVKLQGIFSSFKDASKTIVRFVSALKSLLDTIQDVRDIVQRLQIASTLIAKSILVSLHAQLEDCSHDVCQWAKVAVTLNGAYDAKYRKFLVALKKESFDGIFREIASHKDNISIKLSVIGRHLNIQHTSHLRAIEKKMAEAQTISTTGHQVTTDALQKLESQLSGTEGSPCPSLKSLANQMSDIQSLLRSQSSVESVRSGGAFSGHTPGRPSATSISSSLGSKRTSQYGRSSNLPVRRKSALSLGQIDTRITSRLPRHEDQTSTIPEHLGIPTLSFNPGYTPTQGGFRKVDRPIDGLESSKKLLDAAKNFCPTSLLAYMEIIRISETISLHTKLLTCVRKFQGSDSLDILDTKEYQDVQQKLDDLRIELIKARRVCWMEGLDMEDIDKVLNSGYGQVNVSAERDGGDEVPCCWKDLPPTNLSSQQIQWTSVLSQQLQKLQADQSWTNKLDRVNTWLLQNLASSEEATALHRSFLTNSNLLNVRQWAKLVLKYWLIDDAAVQFQNRSPSTIGAMMDGKCHSTRVKLDLPVEDWKSLDEAASAKCFDICSESGWKRELLWKKCITITVMEINTVSE